MFVTEESQNKPVFFLKNLCSNCSQFFICRDLSSLSLLSSGIQRGLVFNQCNKGLSIWSTGSFPDRLLVSWGWCNAKYTYFKKPSPCFDKKKDKCCVADWPKRVGCWSTAVTHYICQYVSSSQFLLVQSSLSGGDIWINSGVEQDGQTKRKNVRMVLEGLEARGWSPLGVIQPNVLK